MYIQKKKRTITNIPRADELTESQADKLSIRLRLVSLVEAGKTPRQALIHLSKQIANLPKSKRWAQKIYADYVKSGKRIEGLIDKRWRNKRPEVLTEDVKDAILAVWYARGAAGSKAVWKEAVKLCKLRNLPCPGYETTKKFLAAQSENDKLVREGKSRHYDKQNRPVTRIENTTFSNERWQIDHSRLDIWVREFVNNEWVVREVWISAVLDSHSRSIPGFILSTKAPDAWTDALLIRHAVLPKENKNWHNCGLTFCLQPDRGRDFLSHAFQASLAYLNILCIPDPPYYPNSKGKIERFFHTLDTSCLRRLPGHMHATTKRINVAEKYKDRILTRRQLQQEIELWIVDEYHQTEHSETKEKPADLWRKTNRMRMPESEDALDNLLLKSDQTRTIKNTGIQFTIPGKNEAEFRGGRYWAPEIAFLKGHRVQIRYNPEDLESILIYCAVSGAYLGEAWLMDGDAPKYTIADIKRSRNEYRRGLIERQKRYANEVYELDRRKAREAEQQSAWVDAEADEIAGNYEDEKYIDDSSEQIEEFLDMFDKDDEEF